MWEQSCNNAAPLAVTGNHSDSSQRSSRLLSWCTLYSAFDRELFAVFAGIHHFHYFIEGRSFKIWTDHKPLTYALHSVSEPCSIQAAPPPSAALLIFFLSSGVYSFTSGSGPHTFNLGGGPCTFNVSGGLFTFNCPARGQRPRLHTTVSECIKHASTSCSPAYLQRDQVLFHLHIT